MAFVTWPWVSPPVSRSPRFCLLTFWLAEVSRQREWSPLWGLPCLSSSCCRYVTSGHQCVWPSRAPGGGRGVVCSDKGPVAPKWMAGHHGGIIGAMTMSGGPGKQDRCLLLPVVTDVEGQGWVWAVGQREGVLGRPLHLFALGLQPGIHWEAWPRVGPIYRWPQPLPRTGLRGEGGMPVHPIGLGWAGLDQEDPCSCDLRVTETLWPALDVGVHICTAGCFFVTLLLQDA